MDSHHCFQSKQAFRQLGGNLKITLNNWRKDTVTILSHIEALIDFADEDLPEAIADKIIKKVKKLIFEIESQLSQSQRGERIRDGIHIALLGEPNVGKSSLLNTLANRDVAIVSELAGTTRDLIEVYISLRGYPVILYDTAGIRDELDEVEAEGVRRALKKAKTQT